MIFIIAGNYQQAVYWAREWKLNHRAWRYVHLWTDVLGMRNQKYMIAGNPYTNPEYFKIMGAIKGRGWQEIEPPQN